MNLTAMNGTHSDGLAVEDLQRLLQALDFLLAACNTILVTHASVDTCRLELVEVCKRGIKLLLRALQVTLFQAQSLRLVLLLFGLTLDVAGLLSLVVLGV